MTCEYSRFLPIQSVTELHRVPGENAVSFISRTDGKRHLRKYNLATNVEWTLATEIEISVGFPGTVGNFAWGAKGDRAYFVGSKGSLETINPISTRQKRILTSDLVTSVAMSSSDSFGAITLDNRKVAIYKNESGADTFEVLFGADLKGDHFVADVSLGDQLIAFRYWHESTMPWYESRLFVLNLSGSVVWSFFNKGHMVSQPRFSPDGQKLAFVSSHRGNLSLYVVSQDWGIPLVISEPGYDYGSVDLGFGQKTFCWDHDSTGIYANRNERGFGRFIYHTAQGESKATEITKGFVDAPTCLHDSVVGIRSGARTPTQLVAIDVSEIANTEPKTKPPKRLLVPMHLSELEEKDLTEPILYSTSPNNALQKTPYPFEHLNSRVYPSSSGTAKGTILLLHGGPIGQTEVRFIPKIAYLNHMGLNVATIDPRGTTGYGIEFINALNGKWGIADLDDITTVITDLLKRKIIVEPLILMGGSAGGFLALKLAAARTHRVAGIIALYPVVDLGDVSLNTHRFEKNFNNVLVGGGSNQPEIMLKISPVSETEAVQCPVLILQGKDDTVVSSEVTRKYAERLSYSNSNVKCVLFENEGHGWSKNETALAELDLILAFAHENCGIEFTS